MYSSACGNPNALFKTIHAGNRVVGCLFVWLAMLAAAQAAAPDATSADDSSWRFKQELIPVLAEAVPALLTSQDAQTGRFGTGLWIPADQMVIFPLAVAWAVKNPANPHHHDPQLLEAIMRGGEALVETQDARGRWEFAKKDGSTWGMHYNPWVYSRWIRAYSLIRDAMPADRRARWEKGLRLGFSGIATSGLKTVHNIPAHHAMALFGAGQTMNRPEWSAQAATFMKRVADTQDPNGFWSEHHGPVVNYNFVYVDALGVYYALSRDAHVRKALDRAVGFHVNFTYPDGSSIETIDERNPYHAGFRFSGPGFSFSPEGRAYLHEQWKRTRNRKPTELADVIAAMLVYGEEGGVASLAERNRDSVFLMADRKASVIRKGPWCAALSAYVTPVSPSRWIQDRQNFVSLFHEKTGLILGGGNTKLQPLWSTFTVGNPALLKHKPGDESPHFLPPPGLLHVPTNAVLDASGQLLTLHYGATRCSLQLRMLETNRARLTYSVQPTEKTPALAAHATFLPALAKDWRTASGRSGDLKKPFTLTAAEAGPWFEHNGWRVQLPKGARLDWPVLPHNPYRKDGRAGSSEGRIVLTLPFSKNSTMRYVDMQVLN